MASRLDRLVTLLETGSTRLIRDTAASQLADWQKQHPDEQLNLLTRVVPYLRHRDWETRSTAAKAIGKIIENAAMYDPNGSDGGGGHPAGDASPDRLKNSPSFPSAGSLNNGIKKEEEEDSATTTTITELSPPPPIRFSPDEPLRYDRLDLGSILQHGRELLRTGAVELGLGTLKPPDRLAHQKKTLPARLGLLGRRAEDQELAVAGALVPAGTVLAGDAVTALAATATGGDRSSVSRPGGPAGRGADEAGLSSRQLNSLKRKRKKEQKAAKGGGFGDLSAPLSLRRAPSDPAVGKEEDAKSNGSPSAGQRNDYYFSLDRPADVDEAAKVVSEFRGPALPIRSDLEPDSDGDWEGAEWPYERLCDYLKVDLFDPAWEIRHGAAMGLREVVRVHGAGAGRSRGRSRAANNDANRVWLDDVACRLVCVLMLDRFTDYSSDTSVAPIRETVGQTLGSVLKYVPACSVYGVYGILYRMVMGLSTVTTVGGGGKAGPGPTAPERAAAGWAVCHGGMVGLRYVVAVRKDLLLRDGDMIDGVARSVMRGLADRDDDVRSVSAATLIPMTAEFVAMRPAALDRLVAVVWEGLSDLGDDLSASTGRIMDLLATLCGFPEALEAMRRASAAAGDDHDERNDQPEEEREGSGWSGGDHKRDKSEPESGRRSLTHLVPRLYPFLRHTITSVRLSALRALRTLAGLGPDARGWLAGRTLRLVFQNILVERDRETLEGSLALWGTLVGCLAGPGLAIEFGPHSDPMMELTLHPIGTLRCPIPMNGGLFLRPSGGTYPTTAAAPTILPPPKQPSPDPAAEERAPKRRRKSTKPSIADDVPATPLPGHDVDTAMMGGDVEQLGTDVLVRSRVAAARAMGLLMASIPPGGDVDGHGHSQYSLASYRANILHGLASAYSFSQAAACIVAEEHARSRLSMAEDQDESTKSAAATECTGGGLAKALLAVVEAESRPHYRDLVDSLRRVRQECVQLLHVFRDQAKIPAGRLPALPPIVQGEPEAGPAAFSLALAERVAGGEEFDRLRHAAIPGQRLVAAAALEEARAVAAAAIREARVEAEARDVRVRAAAGCALIAMRTMPRKPSPLIRAVMDSIKMEETAELQRRSAAAVVRLVRLLGESGRRGPADKVVANLVKFSCVEVAETPEFGVHAAKTSCVLSLQKEEDRVDRGDGADAAEWAREARAARITRRGAREALETLARTYGPHLLDPDAVPCLRIFMADPLVRAFGPLSGSAAGAGLPPEARDPAGPLGQEIVDAMSLIRTLAPTLDRALLDTFVADLIPLIVAALRSELAVFRYMAAKCMAGICAAAPAQGVTALVERVLPSIGSATDVHLRQGAVEAVYHLIAAMGDAILPYVIFLLVPVLGRMSDADGEVRLLATTAFATLVKLVPLEAGIPDPPGMPAELLRGRDRERAFIAQLLDPKKVERFEIPVSIRAELRPYQRDGVSWLHFLNRYHLHGILCDDMGLGKTLQTLCIVASDHHARAEEHARTGDPNSRPLPSLIVCPPTLAGHWQQELAAYAPFLSVVAYVGPPAERRAVRDRLGAADVVITSYDACRSDVELLVPLAWNYLVLDEGHLIKNPRSKTAIAVKRLAGNHRLILTGTPIQNNVLELWSLFDFLMPGFLGAERVFHDRFARPIAASRHARASSREQEAGALAAESLHKQVLPFLLRRLKEEVLDDLPPKILQNYYCTLSELQRTLFDDFVRRQGSRLRAEASDGDRAAKQHIFQALQYMRKLCNSPALVLRPGHALYEDTVRILRRRGTSLEDPVHAPKLTALRDLLVDCGIGAVAEGGGSGEGGGDSAAAAAAASDPLYQPVKPHRALIFCQMKEMLDMVQNTVLRSMLPSVSYLRLDGSVEPGRRQDIVNRFNTDPSYDVLLLTTSVGGLGLNLTGADTVIFVEHDWNPQKDLQAMDRAHRIGQKKVVNVYRLITRGTLEEKILSLQRFKLDVAGTVVNQQNAAGLASMNSDQILDLFNLGDGGGAGADADGEAAAQPSLITERANKTAGGDDIREEDMVDIETGNVIQQPGKKKKPWLEELGELWDNRQYEESFDLDGFLKTMQ